MSGASSIEWCDSTWSPVVGCTRVSSGCDNCYAVKMTRRLEAMGQDKYAGLVNPGKGHFNGVARLHAPSLDWPLRWRGSRQAKSEGRPSRIFTNPMSDLFHESLSDEAIAAVFGVMAAAPQHTFQVLTKRPERMRAWFERLSGLVVELSRVMAYPECDAELVHAMLLRVAAMKQGASLEMGTKWPLPNVWLGVSVENQPTADERILLLLDTPAAKHFVSYEPALGSVDFTRIQGVLDVLYGGGRLCDPPSLWGIDWVIVGGESGPNARPFDIAWARSTVEQCRAAGVACFVKQLGANPVLNGESKRDVPYYRRSMVARGSFVSSMMVRQIRDRKGGDWNEWPEDLRVREFPA